MNQRLTDLRRAQLDQLLSGDAHMAGGGLLKAAAKAAKPTLKAVQKVLPAAERDANLAKMLEGSKVKDRLYHATPKDFSAFKPGGDNPKISGEAIWLSSDPTYQAAAHHIGDPRKPKAGVQVMPVHVQAKNPMMLDDKDMLEWAQSAYAGGSKEFPELMPKQWADEVKKDYDSIIYADPHGRGDPHEIIMFEPEKIKSAIGNRGTYDITDPDINKAQGGLVHLAGGGDPRKRGLFPKMSTQAIVDSPGFDPEVPSDLSRAYARRMAEKDAYQRSMADQKLTPAQRGTAGLEATGMIGSALFEGVQQLPKLLDGEEAYTKAVGEGMYQPRFQPEKAAEYVGNVGNFLESLETEYKMPALTPELMPFIGAAEAAKQQSKRAVKQGALTAASRMDAGPKAGSMAAQRGVIKMPGGNFLTGRVEKDVSPLKRKTAGGMTPESALAQMKERYSNVPGQEQNIRMLEGDVALNQWIDRNLTNYIKKQMGTPDDPVRALAEQGITHKADLLREDPVYADKLIMDQRREAGFPEEGVAQSPLAKAWERASDESLPSHRAGDIQGMPEKFTKSNEAERKMIASRDALYHKFINHLKSKGISDEEANIVARGTPFDLKARAVGDQDFLQANAEYLAAHDPMMSSYITLGSENPWISKVAPETQVYSSFTGDLGFDHIVDVLKQDVAEGRIRPEQLNKVSMEQAVRRTYEYDQEMAKKMAETQAKVTEGMPVHKEYPEGYKWIELSKPEDPTELPSTHQIEPYESKVHGGTGYRVVNKKTGMKGEGFQNPERATKEFLKSHSKERLADALKYEGDTMGHCVGGYCPDVESGESRIYSLRDAKGEPHVTVEVKPHEGWFTKADKTPDPTGKNKSFHELIDNERSELAQQKGGFGNIGESYEDTANRLANQYQLEAKPMIKQIKGKGNRAPKEDYLPFVQDFVKGGNWSGVGDLQNTGLKVYKGDGGVKYVTPEEYEIELQKELGLLPPAEGMAGGGSVGLKNALNNLLRTDKPEVHMSLGGRLAKPATKAAKAPAVIPNLLRRSTASEIGRDERALRQAAAQAEEARVAAAKKTPVPVGYVKHTNLSPNPHVGYRYEAKQLPGIAKPTPIDIGRLEREKKGASLGVMPWDSQSRNVEVSSISGEPLTIDLKTHGGQPYALDEKHLEELIGGSSGKDVAEAIQERDRHAIRENREKGGTGEVLHAVTTMGKFGENYSNPPSEFAFELINRRLQEGRLTQQDLDYLNNLVKTHQDKTSQREKGIFPYANFAGFETPEGMEQIYTGGYGLKTSPGNLRKAIAKNLHAVEQQKLLGFNSEDLINATTEPSLRGVDKGYIGGTLLSNDIGSAGLYGPRQNQFGMELAPASGFPYNSPYSTDFSARYYGQLPDMIPLDVLMHRQLAPIEQGLLARKNKKPYTQKSLRNAAIGSLEKSNEGVSQVMDSRFFQDLNDYMEALNKPLEKKKGGLAQTKKVKRHGNTVPH